MEKWRQVPLKDLPEVGLYLFLTYLSVARFKSMSMAWYGPLALKLATQTSYDNTSITVGMMGTTVELPNAQTVGLTMLAFLGVLNILDSVQLPDIPESKQTQVQREFVEGKFGTTWENYLEFRRRAT